MSESEKTLADHEREHRYVARLAHARLISNWTDEGQWIASARRLLQEMYMQQVFDRFTLAERRELSQLLVPAARIERTDLPPAFGGGSATKIGSQT